MPQRYPGSTPGVDPRSQGVIPRRFNRKKNFVTERRKDGHRTPHGQTDRCDSRNSYVDLHGCTNSSRPDLSYQPSTSITSYVDEYFHIMISQSLMEEKNSFIQNGFLYFWLYLLLVIKKHVY